MPKVCIDCATSFEVTESDRVITKRFAVPEPVRCSLCRMQRRLAFRNDRSLYMRKCARCKTAIATIFSPDKPHVVYCNPCWWGDGWDATEYGRDFNFALSFNEQYRNLVQETPLMANVVVNSVNSDYNNGCVDSKDVYLSARIGNSEKIFYTYVGIHSLGCIDCFNVYQSNYCYECIDCHNCYNVAYAQNCKNTSDSLFCDDCIGCKNCFGCVGLRNVEYHFFNEKCTKEEYEKRLTEFMRGSAEAMERAALRFRTLRLKTPTRALHIINGQNVTGDYITDSKDIFMGFDIENCESGVYCWSSEHSKDVYDSSFIYYGENHYQSCGSSRSVNISYGYMNFDCNDLAYALFCFNNTKNCFGCIGLKRKQYCILNKQYSKEEYEKLRSQIITHMKKTGEYGAFFDPKVSPFGYNETCAQDYFPLTEEKARMQGYHWHPRDEKEYQPQLYKIPDHISGVQEDIMKAVLGCEECGKNYKVTPMELALYKQMVWPVPRKCPDCRFKRRLAKRNPRRLFSRPCGNCKTPTDSSFEPQNPQRIVCEKCYKEAVY